MGMLERGTGGKWGTTMGTGWFLPRRTDPNGITRVYGWPMMAVPVGRPSHVKGVAASGFTGERTTEEMRFAG